MSDTTRAQAFDPAEEKPIPPWPLSDPLSSKEERVYVLGMNPENGDIEFRYVKRPPIPDPTKDCPLDVRVPTDCVITIELDDSWNWEFRHQNAVMLGPMRYQDFPRYFNLVSEIKNNRCKKVRFNALYLAEGADNRDPYALYILLDQKMADGSPTQPLLTRIDPDILNRGDDPHH
jgi:hypothetical protein